MCPLYWEINRLIFLDIDIKPQIWQINIGNLGLTRSLVLKSLFFLYCSNQDLSTHEAEIVNSYNQDSTSATRATLIFPKYSGYRNCAVEVSPFNRNSQFNVSSPTAYVSPVQSRLSPTPSPKLSFVNASARTPPMTRYSALVTPTLPRRNMPSPFQIRTPRCEGDEGGNFDSDLDSSDGSRPGSQAGATLTVPGKNHC